MEERVKCLNLNAEARSKANGLLEFLRRFETILTAQLFLRIFEVLTPISKYLQDKKNYISKAASMVTNAQKTLKLFTRDFQGLLYKGATKLFMSAKEELENRESPIYLQGELLVKKAKKVRRMDGELNADDPITETNKKYEVDVHNKIMDVIINSMEERFVKKYRKEENCLDFISEKILIFNNEATPEKIKIQLLSFATNWESLKKTIQEDFEDEVEDDDNKMENVIAFLVLDTTFLGYVINIC